MSLGGLDWAYICKLHNADSVWMNYSLDGAWPVEYLGTIGESSADNRFLDQWVGNVDDCPVPLLPMDCSSHIDNVEVDYEELRVIFKWDVTDGFKYK